MRILSYVFSVIALLFVLYGSIDVSFAYQPFMVFFLGLAALCIGLDAFQKGRKFYGWVCIGCFLFTLYASISKVFIDLM